MSVWRRRVLIYVRLCTVSGIMSRFEVVKYFMRVSRTKGAAARLKVF